MITGGTISYGETRRIADYETKTAKVELAFNMPDGVGATEAVNRLEEVSSIAYEHCGKMLKGFLNSFSIAGSREVGKTIEPPKVHSKRAPKMPVAEAPEHLVSEQCVAARAEAAADPAADPAAIEEPKPLAPEITDAMLMDKISQKQEQIKNAPAVRKLINELLEKEGKKHPPNTLIELSQAQRPEFLKRLAELKPLA